MEKEFETALIEMDKFFIEYGKLHRERENYMKSQLIPRIEAMAKTDPHIAEKIKNKEALSVLMGLGAVHTHLYQELKQEQRNGDVSRSFRGFPIFSHFAEAPRRSIMDKKINDSLKTAEIFGKALVEEELTPIIGGLVETSLEREKLAREITASLKLEDIRKIFADLAAGRGIFNALRRRNVKFPTSRKEAEEVLDKK